ncbi:MAG: AAA family ATPase [Planctomycetes bacterium]|nr:AAA family ATPase [Planctomycetota bacterium]
MAIAKRLSGGELLRATRPEDIPFETTVEAVASGEVPGIVGQERAQEALRFGVGMKGEGYNLFAIGPHGVGKHTLLFQILQEHAARRPRSADWCYVHDFAHPERPRALELPAGLGSALRDDMLRAVADLRVAMRAAFESEEYRTRKQQIVGDFQEKQRQALAILQKEAETQGVAVLQTDTGMVIAPLREGEPIPAAEFNALPDDEKSRHEDRMRQVGTGVQDLLRRFRDWGREQMEAIQAVDGDFARATAHRVMQPLRDRFAELPEVLDYLGQVEIDVVDCAAEFLASELEGMEVALKRAFKQNGDDAGSFLRYRVNLLVDRAADSAAPIISEMNPTLTNLVGRVDYESRFGAMVTNLGLVRAGALHRAIGGYLVLDARRVLRNPESWECLKRALRSREIRIESLGQSLGLMATVMLEPAVIPLGDTKVILCGERELYYLLAELDPDFLELFKVLVDFDETTERNAETQHAYARLIAQLVAQEGLLAFDRGAVARVLDHAARMAGEADKLSLRMRAMIDLLREADFEARSAGRDLVRVEDVDRAQGSRRRRADRIPLRILEAMRRHDILIATEGGVVGQINGLSVFQLGEHWFGRPTRISARTRPGKGDLIDIEREVELGGPIHSKGVLILAGFLGARYSLGAPLSLAASLVFEQSYGPVEGDSASLAELCALISALAGLPIDQSLAVTGSIDQYGRVQSIGGVNEKIEGFFDLCRDRGLAGQGVIIPRSNAKNLMLRRDLVAAVEEGLFRVLVVEEVDQALEILTGTDVGHRAENGRFLDESVNGRVEATLAAYAACNRSFLHGGG